MREIIRHLPETLPRVLVTTPRSLLKRRLGKSQSAIALGASTPGREDIVKFFNYIDYHLDDEMIARLQSNNVSESFVSEFKKIDELNINNVIYNITDKYKKNIICLNVYFYISNKKEYMENVDWDKFEDNNSNITAFRNAYGSGKLLRDVDLTEMVGCYSLFRRFYDTRSDKVLRATLEIFDPRGETNGNFTAQIHHQYSTRIGRRPIEGNYIWRGSFAPLDRQGSAIIIFNSSANAEKMTSGWLQLVVSSFSNPSQGLKILTGKGTSSIGNTPALSWGFYAASKLPGDSSELLEKDNKDIPPEALQHLTII